MIKAEFQKYGSYTTDSLYQWDLNQELQFVDTDISVAPVIHFCNRKSKESLLVQSTLTEGIITCPVPNVLLQEPFDIIAYIVSMEAQKATTLFKMLIPVNRRLKPADYEHTDNIPILTYEAIKADIQHFFNLSKAEIAVERERINKIIVPETTFKNIAIRKFESKINDGSYIDETSRRVFGMSWVEQVNPMYDPNSYIFKNPFLLYAFGRGYDPNTGSWDDYVQITGDVRLKSNRLEVGVNFIDSDKIYTKAEMYAVVAYDNTVDNTELEDIRVGIDGKIHDSAGDAVRSQIGKLKEDLSDLSKEVGHTSTNLLKITGYEITAPNIGVSFSLGDDGRIVMSGKATNSNFVIRLNCEGVQLNSGEDYTVNISSQFTNVSTRLMRKVPIGGTSAEVTISGKTSVTWTATNSVISYITLTLPSGYSTDYDGYIWFSKGMQATNYEPVGFIGEVVKKAEFETFKKSVNANVSGFSDELFERCGLIEKKGVFESFSPTTFSSGIDVLNAPFEYNRFNNVSKKIIVKPSTSANYYNIQQAFTFGNFESITVLMYTTVRAFNNKSKLQFYIQLASSKASNKYGTAMFVDTSLLNVGWGAYKIPLSAFTFANGASIDDMDLMKFRLRVFSSPTEDLEIICGGYIYNERMKPTVVMSFDGVYDTDTETGGKFDALIQNKIHATMFQSVNTKYSDDTKSVFYNHVINDGLEIQMYATANREYVQTEDDPETQYNELRTQKEWLYENRIGGLPTMYAAPNGILPNTTINLLKSLDFKMARSGSAYFVNRFTKKDFNVGFKGIFGTNSADTINDLIDETIADGKTIFLFTHKVKDNPTSYDSGIANFKSVCDYIGQKIADGELQSMNFTEFYNACVN